MLKLISKEKLILIPAIIFVTAVAGTAIYISYINVNPALEKALREQFGEDFFKFESELPEVNSEADQLEDIIDKYEPLFLNLEERSLERLETLFQNAIAEYNERKKTGTYDRLQLTNKYSQAGRLLEQNVDRSFYLLLNQMETELKRRDLPTGIIKEIESSFIAAKTEKKLELFGRLREKVNR